MKVMNDPNKLVILVGPPGSGKSTLAKSYENLGFVRISQDDQGKTEHIALFEEAIREGRDIVVDRMNFNKPQRERYLAPARKAGYETFISVLQVPKEECRARVLQRENHPTIKDEYDAANALSFFFKSYERPTKDEADMVVFEGGEIKFLKTNISYWNPNTNSEEVRSFDLPNKQKVVVFDIDGTVADIEHRRHHVRKEPGVKKDWYRFNLEMVNDKPKNDIIQLVRDMSKSYPIVFCSGRTDDFRKETEEWLKTHIPDVKFELYMRPRNDSRQDNIIKEIILDFELQTRYDILCVFDDRDQVVKMWRDRGITCLQVDYGDF